MKRVRFGVRRNGQKDWNLEVCMKLEHKKNEMGFGWNWRYLACGGQRRELKDEERSGWGQEFIGEIVKLGLWNIFSFLISKTKIIKIWFKSYKIYLKNFMVSFGWNDLNLLFDAWDDQT